MKKGKRTSPPLLRNARQLRHRQTAAEATLWRALRARNLEGKFRRQHPIDTYIVDFYCAEARLCIEIDGGTHFEPGQAELDAARTTVLQRRGYEVIRFTNTDVRHDLDAVVATIVEAVHRRRAGIC